MNPDETRELKNLIVSVASYYGRQITPAAVVMMADDLAHLRFCDVRDAYAKYRRTDRSQRFPMPAAIMQLVAGEVDPRSVAVEASTRVIAAVSKFGWCNGAGAREYIGDLGWRAVERLGGWCYLCENLGLDLQVTTVQAQVRDLCEATLRMGEAGVFDSPPALPSSERAGLDQVGDILTKSPLKILE